MAIRSCKMQTNVKPSLYASLDIIHKIGMNGTKPQSRRLKMDSHIIKLVQNGPKWSETVQNYRKWVKNFKNSINSKKFKNSISFEIFTHLSSKLPTRISGASSCEIRHRLF